MSASGGGRGRGGFDPGDDAASGAVGHRLLAGITRWRGSRTARAPSPPATSTGRPESERLEAERAALVRLCVELADLLPQPALRTKIRRGLAHVGVTMVVPQGERFDPERRCAVGVQPTPDVTCHDRIAVVERPGVVDRGREMRLPDVVVWHFDALAEPSPQARVGLEEPDDGIA